MNSGGDFPSLLLVVQKHFPWKGVKMLEEVAKWLVRSGGRGLDEAKTLQLAVQLLIVFNCAKCGQAWSQGIRGPSCWPELQLSQFWLHHQFAEHTSQMQWFHRDSESCGLDQASSRPPAAETMAFYSGCKLGFWKCLSLFSVRPLSQVVAGCHRKILLSRI